MANEALHRLSALLGTIWLLEGEAEINYSLRNDLVLTALATARSAGLAAGVRLDPTEPAWPVVFIELPTGQVSWHLPHHAQSWDGHTTEEKYDRIHALIAAYPPHPKHAHGERQSLEELCCIDS